MQKSSLLALTLGAALASGAPGAAADAKTEQLLAQARAALGGESALARVQGLTASGSYRRTLQDRELSGDLMIDMQLPDKLLRTESMSPHGDVTVITEQGIAGETLLRSQRALNAPPGVVIRMGPPPAGDAEAQAIRNARADLARLAIALLLSAPSSFPVEFAHGGEAESPDGKADVLDAKGPGSFALRIFLDKASHRPLMLSYRGVAPRLMIQTQRMGPGDQQRGEGAAAHAAASPPAPVEIDMFLADYKKVDGVWLPHHVSRSIDAKPSEEWTIKSFKLNPAFKPDTFSAR
jgi:hypothetical protein